MPDGRANRVAAMSAILDECAAAAADLNAAMDRLEALRDDMTALHDYYGSEDWYGDREAALSPDTPAGVLSEDAVYNEITDLRGAAIRMLELATDVLKNRL